jgi:hypothetical protein
MATTPMFSPDQDMTDVSPEDVAEAKRRAKATAAYNKVSTIAPSPKPAASAARVGRKDTIKPSNESPYGGERLIQPKQQMMDELDRMTGKAKLYDKQAANAIANRKEAEKEGQKYAKGGYVRAADGCAQRGKTRGKMM